MYYEPFTSALHEVVKDFKLPMNEMGYYVTRIEEEHLWEAKQLGAHSPQVKLLSMSPFKIKTPSLFLTGITLTESGFNLGISLNCHGIQQTLSRHLLVIVGKMWSTSTSLAFSHKSLIRICNVFQVLLNTLVYFNTKFFMLRSAEDHQKLSFTHVMKHWKKNSAVRADGQKAIILRYYPPAKRGT